MLNQLRDSESGVSQDDVVRQKLYSKYKAISGVTLDSTSTMYQYIFESKVGFLDYGFIQDLIDSVGLTTDEKARDLVGSLVKSLDQIIISEDMGSLLGSLLFGNEQKTKTDAETGEVTYGYIGYNGDDITFFYHEDKDLVFEGSSTNLKNVTIKGQNKAFTKIINRDNALDYWEIDYSYPNADLNGNGKVDDGYTDVKAGDKCKDLKEFLIAMIMNYLYSGELHTMLFKLLNEMIGPMIFDMGGPGMSIDYSILAKLEGSNAYLYGAFLRDALATMPQWYLAGWDGKMGPSNDVTSIFDGTQFGTSQDTK